MLSTEPYKGVRDFYPPDKVKLEYIFKTIRTVLTLHGYEEYDASPLERAELYETKTSEEIVKNQTYTFTDRGDRKVTLRPEMTPTVARMVAGKRQELVFPLRWFCIPSMYRYENTQRGRLREFFQFNMDIFGLPEGDADIEMIVMVHRIMTTFGALESDFSIHINSRILLTNACVNVGMNEKETADYIRLLDKKNKMPKEKFDELVRAILKEKKLPIVDISTLSTFITVLKKRGVNNAVYDASITRGFDYYTGIVFEVFDTHPENSRSMFGGGRYDNLTALFGGAPIPAVGCAAGDVILSDFLTTHDLWPDDLTSSPLLFLATTTPSQTKDAEAIADTIRKSGISVFVNLTEKKVGDQIREAVRRKIPFVAVIGDDEIKTKKLSVKRLRDGKAQKLSFNKIASFIEKV